MTLLTCILLILGLSGYLPENGGSHEEGPFDGDVYLSTLNLFDEANPGYGYDEAFTKEPLQQPKAYALYASAESHRFRETGNESAMKNAIRAANWLVANSDLDGDGEKGWGLPFAWDAGGDGTINPENTEYTIQTAIGVQALLDVYDTAMQAGYETEVPGFLATATEAMETFLKGRYDESDKGIVFWFSTLPDDDYHVFNPTAMLAGQLQRLSHYPVTNQSLFSEWADRCILYILAHQQQDSDGNPYWMYYEGKPPRSLTQNRPNDLAHEVYTLQGLFDYKIFGGRYSNSIDAKILLSTLNRFVNGSKVHDLSVGYPYTQNWQREAERWGRVWSVGYALHFAVRLESYLNEPPILSTKLATMLIQKYKKNNQWLLRPDDKETQFYPRQTAFVLQGLAFYEFGNSRSEKHLVDSLDGHTVRNETQFKEKPLYPFTYRGSAEDYINSSKLFNLDENGIFVTDYGSRFGGAGLRYSPTFSATYALVLYQDLLNTNDSAKLEALNKQAQWLLKHKTERYYRNLGFWVWEFDFDNTKFEAKAPWVSALSQGRVLCAFLAAYDLTDNPEYLRAAECAFRSFLVPVSSGGVTTFENNVAWYEEYADEEAPSGKILNGHIAAVQALWTFWKWTGREDAKRCLDLGIAAVRRDLALYDAGFLSYYSQFPPSSRIYAPASGYNTLHVHQLLWLYEVAKKPVFLEYALRFSGYDAPGWNITTAGSTDPVGHGPDNLFFRMGIKYWSHNKFPTWVQFNLRESQVIDGIVFLGINNKTTPRDFQVFVSDDGKKWSLILERTGNKEQYLIERFEPVRARFAKLVILNDNGNNNVALAGVAVLRVDAVPTAVSNWESFSSGNLPSRVFGEGWKTPEKGWIVADLGKTPQDIVVEMASAGSRCSFSILGTNDLKSFDTIALPAIQQTKDGWKIALQHLRSRYIKIEFHEGCKKGKLLIRRL